MHLHLNGRYLLEIMLTIPREAEKSAKILDALEPGSSEKTVIAFTKVLTYSVGMGRLFISESQEKGGRVSH